MSRLPLVLSTTAVAAVLAGAAPASAQPAPGPVLSASVSPKRAGTARKPRSASVHMGVTLPAQTTRTVGRITLRLPAHVRLAPKGFPGCRSAQVRALGEASCPAGARVGAAVLQGTLSTPEPTPVTWTAAVYAATSTRLTLAVKGLVATAFEARVTGHGRRLTVLLPAALRTPYAGWSARFEAIDLSVGAVSRTVGRGRQRRSVPLVALTGCPADRRHDFVAEVAYSRNDAGAAPPSVKVGDASACRAR